MNRFSSARRRSAATSLVLAAFLTLPLTLTSVGCGGGFHNVGTGSASPVVSGQGRATFAVRWPESTGRLVPLFANSIVIVIRSADGKTVGNATLNRPAGSGALSTSTTIDPLPTGDLIATAAAYPERDGAGVAQATAAAPLAILAGSNTEIHLVPQSTIDHLDVTAASASVGVAYSVQVAATARDAEGNIVLTSPSKRRYTLSDPQIARIDSTTGILTGNSVGTAQVTVTDDESGKTGTVTIKVTRSAAYQLNWIDPLPDMPYVTPEGVNAKGEVVGVCSSSASTGASTTGFYWKPGSNGATGETISIPPPPGFSTMHPFAINNQGQVVGAAVTTSATPRIQAFLWENGKTTILPAPVSNSNYQAQDINSSGDIIGYTFISGSGSIFGNIPCVWRNGTPLLAIPAGTPAVQGITTDINDSGTFISSAGNGSTGPFLVRFWSPSFARTDLQAPSGRDTLFTQDINASGQVAGSYILTGQNLRRGFVLTNGRFTEVEPLPNTNQTSTLLEAIADDGTAIGTSRGTALLPLTPQSNVSAIRWRYGKTEDLNSLLPANTMMPFRLQQATAISRSGLIAGSGFRGDAPQGFVLTPQGGTGGANVGVN